MNKRLRISDTTADMVPRMWYYVPDLRFLKLPYLGFQGWGLYATKRLWGNRATPIYPIEEIDLQIGAWVNEKEKVS